MSLQYQLPIVAWTTVVPTVHLANLEDIEAIMKNCVNRNTHGLTGCILGDGIMFQTEEKWKKAKRVWLSAFGQNMLLQYMQVFNEQCEVLVNLLHQKAIEGGYFDLWPFLINANDDIIMGNIPKYMTDILLVNHIKDPDYMTEYQINSELIHFMSAARETTTITECSTLLMYGIHQAEQEAVYQEIRRIIPEDRPITIEDVDQLNYMEKTIKETLRLFTIVPITFRTTSCPVTLPSGNTVPENTDVFLHWKQIHKNPLYYPNPNKWNPENFNAESVEARPKNSFAPFGFGKRSCLGSRYGMLSIKVQIVYILRKYKIFTDTKLDEIVLDQGNEIHCRSRHGYRIKLHIRGISEYE